MALRLISATYIRRCAYDILSMSIYVNAIQIRNIREATHDCSKLRQESIFGYPGTVETKFY